MWSDRTSPLSVMREDVAKFVEDRGWGRYHAPVNVASAAAVEAGELLELFQWRRPDDPVPPEVVQEAGQELADVLHFVLCLQNAADMDLPSDDLTFSQLLADASPRELGPKEAAEEVMVAASFLLMAARASSITREVARTSGEEGPEDAMLASVSLLLESLAKCARSMGLDLSAQLYAKNRLNEERFPVGTMPDVGY
jgi:NTP pyrophosphatase (non-canonical NTP hydrolase)